MLGVLAAFIVNLVFLLHLNMKKNSTLNYLRLRNDITKWIRLRSRGASEHKFA